MGPNKLPTQRTGSGGLDGLCSVLDIDHCFDGWHGEVVLQDSEITVRLRSSLDHLVVFTHAGCDFVAIEPVSHVNNAVNMAGADTTRMQHLGVRILQPGQSHTATMRIETGPAT
jgi:aldose 1-epimerase